MKRVLSVLEGQKGVDRAEEDAEPKTVRVLYRPEQIMAAELLDVINRADLRLQAHRHLRDIGGLAPGRTRRTAQLLSDDETTE